MKVREIMSRQLITVNMDSSLAKVKDIFDQFHFHHVLIVEDEMLFGILSDRDLLKSISPFIGTAAETSRDRDTLKKRVHFVMSRNIISLGPDAGLNEAIHLFNTHNISCIPIVDENNKPIGLISWRDVLKLIESKHLPV